MIGTPGRSEMARSCAYQTAAVEAPQDPDVVSATSDAVPQDVTRRIVAWPADAAAAPDLAGDRRRRQQLAADPRNAGRA